MSWAIFLVTDCYGSRSVHLLKLGLMTEIWEDRHHRGIQLNPDFQLNRQGSVNLLAAASIGLSSSTIGNCESGELSNQFGDGLDASVL